MTHVKTIAHDFNHGGSKPRRKFLNRFNGSHANKDDQSSGDCPSPHGLNRGLCV